MTPDQVWQAMLEVGATSLHMQKERGNVTGLLHYQGYVEFGIGKRFSSLKKISKEIHWESRQGTAQQAVEYVSKEETRVGGPWKWGELQNPEPQPGRRSDLQDAIQTMKEKGVRAMAEEHPMSYVRYFRGLERLDALRKVNRPNPPQVILLIGPPGAGKSRYVRDVAPGVYVKPISDGFWFDFYFRDKDVLIDEFEGAASKWSLTQLNQVVDRYDDTVVPYKGGFVPWVPERIFITTNTHPRGWYNYDNREDRYVSLARRFTQVIKWEQDGQGPFILEGQEMRDMLGI